MKILDKLLQTSNILHNRSFENPMKEAEIIVTHATKLEVAKLFLNEYDLTKEEIAQIDTMLKERLQKKPLQYIIGSVKFFDLEIRVGHGVLIPRPETEFMVECAIRLMNDRGFDQFAEISILDLCTGSGCIALSLAKHFKNALVIGTDISLYALSYAHMNKSAHNIPNVLFLEGDMFAPLSDNKFHLIISNPPYISTSEIRELQSEIRDYEPHIALDGGINGIVFYNKIFSEAIHYLQKDGLLILEIGYGQSMELRKLAERQGYSNIKFINDYSDIERVLVAGVN